MTEVMERPSRFVPEAEPARFKRPRATIDPDPSKKWIKRAWPVLRSHKATLATALILSFAGLVIQVGIPEILQSAFNNSVPFDRHGVVVHRHLVPISHYVWILMVLAAVSAGSAYLARLYLLRTAYALEFDFRNIIYEHLTKLSFPFYDRVQSGQLISRANSDIRSVQMYLTFGPSILVQCATALVAFGFMLSVNVWLALVAMVTVPFVYLLSVVMRNALFPVSWLIQSRLADVATIVDENINGVRVVKSFAAEQRELETLAKAATRLQWAYVKDADLRARFTPAVQNLSQLGLAAVLLVGGYEVLHGGLQLGAIVSFSYWIVLMQLPFQMLGMLVMMGQRAAASAARIYEILDERPTVVDPSDALELEDCRGDVSFEDVSFAYPTRATGDPPRVLEGFNLHLSPGETVAMVGRTGTGKSTIARLLARLYDVDSGAVRLDGHDVRTLTQESVRGNVGIVLDEPFLFSASLRENIAYARPDADMADIEAAARAAGAAQFIGELEHGYETIVGERGYTLSGGQRQRVAIARTLLANPPVLILDDATSAVDVQTEQGIHEALRTLMTGRTTLIIAHRLSTIGLADRVVLVDDGRIVADGTHLELLANYPLYAAVLAHEADEEILEQGVV